MGYITNKTELSASVLLHRDLEHSTYIFTTMD